MEPLEQRMLLAVASLDSKLTDKIESPGEIDEHTFSITQAEQISITLDAILDGTDDLGGARVALLDPIGQTVSESDVLNGEAFLSDVDLLMLGTYTITVQAPSGEPDRVGDYELHLADRDPAAKPMGFGSSEPGCLDVRGRVQLFDLDVTAVEIDKPFTVALDGDGTVKPVLELLNPAGTVVAAGASGDYTYDTRIADFAPNVTGTYQVRVTALGDTLGHFELGVSDRPVEASQGIPFSTFAAGYLERLADEDVYTFSGFAEDEVTITVAGTGFLPDLTVSGPDGYLSGTGVSDTSLTLTLPSDGVYSVLVCGGGAAGLGNGSYLLSVSDPSPVIQPIAFGQRLPGTVHAPGDFEQYSLVVSAAELGKPVSIVVSASDDYYFGQVLELYGPDGTKLTGAYTTTGYSSYAVEIDDFALPVAGTYTIRVSDYGNNNTGRFTVGVSDQPITTAATLPAFNTTITGSISPLGDVDDYTFTGAAGDVITVERLSSDFDLTLFGPDGAVVTGAGTSDGLLDLVTLPSAGTYTLRIEPRGGTVSSYLDDTGDYSFAVWKPTRAPAPIPITFGENQPGQVAIRGDIVEYSLVVSAAEVDKPVSIVVSASDNYYFGQVLELYGPDGTKLTEAYTTIGYSSYAVEIDDFALPVAGTYTIRVSDYGNNNTGSFTVGVSDQPITTAVALPAFDTTITGSISPLGDVDDYTFTGAAGEVITVERLSSDFDLTLFGSDGSVVTGAGTSDGLLDLVTLPSAGTYTLRIEPRGGTVSAYLDDTGDYSFAVWKPTREPVPIPITFGESQPGQVAIRGDIVEYSLVVSAAEVDKPVSIVVSASDNYYFGQVLELYGPDGTKLTEAYTTIGYSSYAVEIDDFALPVAGTYTIRVSDYGNNNTGSFTVGVSDQPIESPITVEIGSKTAGYLGPFGDVDEYQIQPSTTNPVSLYVTAGTAELDTDVTVLRSDGSEVGTATSGNHSSYTFTPVSGQTYTVRIEPGGGTVSPNLDNRGIYLLEVSDTVNPTVYLDDVATVALGQGASHVSTIDGSGDIDAYTFMGTAGQRLRIAVATGYDHSALLRADVNVFGPRGVLLTSSTVSTEADLKDFGLPADGEYRVEVSGRDSDVGPYAIGISDRPAEELSPATLTPGETSSGSLEYLADEDVYQFSYTTGSTINLAGTSQDSACDLEMLVYSPIGSLLYYRTGSSVSLTETTLPSGGDYSVVLRGSQSALTDYQVSFTSRPAGTPPPPASIPGELVGPIVGPVYLDPRPIDTLPGEPPTVVQPLPAVPSGYDDLGSLALTFGDIFVSQFPSAEGEQTFELSVTAGDVLDLVVEATDRFDSNLTLFDPSGVRIADSSSGVNSSLTGLLASSTGTYQAIVTGAGEGGFAISAWKRDIEPATDLTLDGPAVAAVFDSLAQQHRYRFQITHPETVNLSVTPFSADLLDTDLQLIGTFGQVITTATSGSASNLGNLRLLGTGEYTVLVRPEHPSGGLGGYSIGLTRGETPSIVPSTNTAISFASTADGSITSEGGEVLLSLSVDAEHVSKPVSIVVSASDNYYFGQVLELYGPDGTKLTEAYTTMGYSNYAVEIDDFALPVAGTYTIRVSDYGNNNTGSFTVGVSDQPISDPTPLLAFDTKIEVEDAIMPLGDVDDYTFTGTAGEIVTVERLFSTFDLTLYGPDGSVVAGGGTADSLLDLVTLPCDGTYTLRIEPSGGTVSSALEDTGDYSFAIFKPTREPAPIPITFGESQPNQKLGIRGDILEYSLEVAEAEAGKPVSIVVSASDNYYFGQVLELYGPDGTKLTEAYTTMGYSNYAVEIDDFALPVAGTYTIRVSDYGNNNTGSFTVGVSDQPISDPTPLLAFDTKIEVEDAIMPLGGR